MQHGTKDSITEMYGLLEFIFVGFAVQLQVKYPNRTIRSAAVIASGVPEFARLGFIKLVDARTRIPQGMPDCLVRTIKRAKYQPIWIPGVNFPDDPMDIYQQMKPSLRNNKVVWRHIPSKRSSPWGRCKP